jgi:hypothetical protein
MNANAIAIGTPSSERYMRAASKSDRGDVSCFARTPLVFAGESRKVFDGTGAGTAWWRVVLPAVPRFSEVLADSRSLSQTSRPRDRETASYNVHMLIKGMTEQEIRVLQEFRRLAVESLTVEAIKAIKHPAGGGEAPALALVGKGLLAADAARENFALTPAAKEFLSYDPKPEFEEGGSPEAAASEVAE